MNTKITALVTLFLLFNMIPAIGASLELWPTDWLWYFYGIEVAGFGVLSLFRYAKHLLVFSILLGLVFGLLSLIDLPFWSDLRVPLTFWSLYSLSWLVYFELGKSAPGLWLKQRRPSLRFSFYLGYMGLAIAGCFALTITLFDVWAMAGQMPFKVIMIFLGVAALIPTFMIGILRIINMVGPKHFLHFLIGTYHRPKKTEKIVLFIDMVGSTTVAEKMMPLNSMALIAQFIFDAGTVFRRGGGDIVNYTGDGLTVLWPTTQADKAVKTVEELQRLLQKKAEYYTQKFKHVPNFRIGLHAGDVVISQIGEEKLFLGLYGDVVNTAARLEALSKELEVPIVFSKAVQQRLSNTMKGRTTALGLKNIKGRQDRVEVFTLNMGAPIKGEKS